MKDKARLSALEEFAKNVEAGNPLTEDYVRTKLPEVNPAEPVGSRIRREAAMAKRALQARDLAGDALAQQVLKNTRIPIPDDNASRLKKEDFFKRLMAERYPELEFGDDDINFSMLNEKDIPDGLYNPDSGKIFLKNRPDTIRNVADLLHEGGHKLDYEKLNFDGTPDVSDINKTTKIPSGRNMFDVDPTEMYEVIAKGHHAEIPKLREGAFELGALKSYLKSGTFKALPIIGTAATAAAALSSPDASAAAMDMAIPGGLESLGPSAEDAAIENPQANPELRKAALQKLMER